jgi:hypothetical protein
MMDQYENDCFVERKHENGHEDAIEDSSELRRDRSFFTVGVGIDSTQHFRAALTIKTNSKMKDPRPFIGTDRYTVNPCTMQQLTVKATNGDQPTTGATLTGDNTLTGAILTGATLSGDNTFTGASKQIEARIQIGASTQTGEKIYIGCKTFIGRQKTFIRETTFRTDPTPVITKFFPHFSHPPYYYRLYYGHDLYTYRESKE